MPSVQLNLRKDVLDRLVFCARGNRHSLHREIVLRVCETFSGASMARRAKIAVVAGTRSEATDYARASGYRRDQWFYAYDKASATGRYVRKIEMVGHYRRHKHLDELLQQLKGGEAAAKYELAHTF